jgi:hypothetical protein
VYFDFACFGCVFVADIENSSAIIEDPIDSQISIIYVYNEYFCNLPDGYCDK